MFRYLTMFLLGEVAITAGTQNVYIGYGIAIVAGVACVVWGKEDKKEKTDAEN